MLRHESGDQQVARQSPGADLQLTPDEFNEVLNDAIARQAAEPAAHAAASTLEDALEIARQLNVPEEHVLAAAEDLRRRKLAAQQAALRAGTRGERKLAIRRGRRNAFIGWTTALGLATAASWVMGLAPMLFTAATGLVGLLLLFRWLFAPISDAEADRAELMPVAGVCQVCGQPAHTPQSTLCEEHRFKPPAG